MLCLILSACSAEKKLNKLYLNEPALVADKTRQWFPCVTTKLDTTISIVDSVVYIDCPEIKDTREDYAGKETVIVKMPVSMPTKYVYIKQKVEDSAKVFVRDNIIATTGRDLEKTKTQVVRKNNFNWMLICVCIVLLFLNILQFKNGNIFASKK